MWQLYNMQPLVEMRPGVRLLAAYIGWVSDQSDQTDEADHDHDQTDHDHDQSFGFWSCTLLFFFLIPS